MKKLLLVTTLGLLVSSQAFAAGSTVTNSRILNNATVRNSLNVAGDGGFLGRGGDANLATVKIDESTLRNTTVSNRANVSNSRNFGGDGGFLGRGGDANMASIIIE